MNRAFRVSFQSYLQNTLALGRRIRSEDRGALTFEWILLITLIVIGVVGGLSAVRDAVISELGDVAEAAVHIDQSYTVVSDPCLGIGTTFGFQDSVPACTGQSRPAGPAVTQGPVESCQRP